MSSARGNGPPARCSASATRADGSSRYRPGVRTAPATCTKTSSRALCAGRSTRGADHAVVPPSIRRGAAEPPLSPPNSRTSASVARTATTAQITTVPPTFGTWRPYEGRRYTWVTWRPNGATIWRVERFKAILGGEDGEAPTVELPFDTKERFGKTRAPVRGTVNGTDHRTTVRGVRRRPPEWFQARASRARDRDRRRGRGDGRARRGAAHGGPAARARDGSRRGQACPGRLRRAYSHRREYAEWIAEAKRRDTRRRGVAQTLEELREGRRLAHLGSRSAPPGPPLPLVYAFDVGAARPPPGPVDHRGHRVRRPPEHGLHRPVRPVETQPTTPSSEARRRVESRKKTPCT